MEEKEVRESSNEGGQFLDFSALNNEPKNYLVRNHYYFNDEINPDTARALIINLHELALSIVDESLKVGSIPCPIELHINSPGGSLTDALQIVQVIKDIQSGKACKIGDALVPVKINTHIEGEADSASSLIAAIGNYRSCSKYAMSLIHPMRSLDATFKTVEERDVALENDRKWSEIYKNVYLEHSKLTKEQLDTMFKTETYYTPQQLLEFGLIEEII
jgi:ATP-dependent protease ClpP protease subunit